MNNNDERDYAEEAANRAAIEAEQASEAGYLSHREGEVAELAKRLAVWKEGADEEFGKDDSDRDYDIIHEIEDEAVSLAGTAAALLELLFTNPDDFVSRLDSAARDQLRGALAEVKYAETDSEIVAGVRAILKEAGLTKVRAVVFDTEEYDNGYFLYEGGTAYLVGGETVDVDGYAELHDAFCEYGKVGSSFKLAVNPNTGAVDGDDYGDHASVIEMVS